MKEFNKDKELLKLNLKKNKNIYIKRISIVFSVVFLLIGIIYFTFAKFENKSAVFTLIQGNVKYEPNTSLVSGNAEHIIEKTEEYNNTINVIDNGTNEAVDEEDICTYTLAYDGTVDNNLRYVGKNPCNYVSFNNELWRIIGVMNNMYTSEDDYNNKTNGTSLLKIVRSDILRYDSSNLSYSWDTSAENAGNNGYGINQWGESGTYPGADAMRELNNDYLGNIVVGTDNKWYSKTYDTKAKIMPSNTFLNSTSQSFIQPVVWNTGTTNDTNKSLWTTPYMYTAERSNTNGKFGTINSNDNVVRTTAWYGKVGLEYSSDYGYATTGGTSMNRNTCLSKSLNNWGDTNTADCRNNDWIFPNSYGHWTISPSHFSGYSYCLRFSNNGKVDEMSCYADSGLRPTLYLKSSTKISSGSGSKSDPYILN